jgi:hypothetical protein
VDECKYPEASRSIKGTLHLISHWLRYISGLFGPLPLIHFRAIWASHFIRVPIQQKQTIKIISKKMSQIKPLENVTKFMCLERTVTFQNGFYIVAPCCVI